MKKLLRGISFFFKVIMLVFLLFGGWLYLNVTNLVKGKKSADRSGQNFDDLFGTNQANADAAATAATAATGATGPSY